jgi:hypothetical protein
MMASNFFFSGAIGIKPACQTKYADITGFFSANSMTLLRNAK